MNGMLGLNPVWIDGERRVVVQEPVVDVLLGEPLQQPDEQGARERERQAAHPADDDGGERHDEQERELHLAEPEDRGSAARPANAASPQPSIHETALIAAGLIPAIGGDAGRVDGGARRQPERREAHHEPEARRRPARR